MALTIACKSCKKLVARTPNHVCANCRTQNWGYNPADLQAEQTLKNTPHTIVCANCLTLVARTPNQQCIACYTHNWGYTASQLQNPTELIQIGESPAVIKAKRQFNTGANPMQNPKAVAIEAESIVKVVNNGTKTILQELDLVVNEGEFVALMGPSGCGKTTLLKCLNAVSPPSAGAVKIHGKDLLSNYEELKRSIGYVPQEDIVHRDLTVEQTLFYAAKLRMPDNTGREEINNRILEVLKILKIEDAKIKNERVGKLSGGQRKRVSIAVELLNRPTILFLDEPTSPLDPETIDEFLKCIQDLARNHGTTIIMVTHKPDDLNYVDKVVFLGIKGYLVYDGDRNQVLSYFGKKSLVEVYATFGSDEKTVKQWNEKWTNKPISPIVRKKATPIKNNKSENAWRQFLWLSRRYAHIKVSNTKNIAFLLFQPLFVAVMLWWIFDQLQISIVFLTAISAIWFGVNNSATEIVEELPIYKRERMFNLRIIPYIASKIVILSIIAFLQVVIFISFIYLGFSGGDLGLNNYAHSVLFMFYLSVSAILLGLLFSSAIDDKETVLTIMPLSLIPQIIFAGVVAPIDKTIKAWASYIWLGRWGTQGFTHIQEKVITKIPVPSNLAGSKLIDKDSTVNAIDQLRLYGYLEDVSKIPDEWSYGISTSVMVILYMNVVIFAAIIYFLNKKDSVEIKGKK